MRSQCFVALVIVSVFVGGCAYDRQSTGLGPSPAATAANSTVTAGSTGAVSYVGTWATTAATVSALNPSTCGNLQWSVSSQTASQISGTFSAQCAGGISLSGTASGQLGNSQSIPITIQGTGSMPNLASCSFSVTGTGAIIDNATALQVSYSGTTCQGPIAGTETLHKKSATPDPAPTTTPAPTPAPTPTPTPVVVAVDQMNLSQATVYNSPPDVASWPITTKITQLQMLGCAGGLAPTFSAQNTWPDYTPPGWGGPLQYTLWAVVNVNGQWVTSGFIQFWRGRDNTGAPILPLSCGFPVNWAYDARWGPMNGYAPQVGEAMGFFVTAGDARNQGGVTSLRERSNVVVVNLPPDTGFYSW